MRSNSWDNKENTSLTSSSRGCAAADGSQTLHRKPKSAVSRSKRMRNRSLEMVLDDPTATDSSATKRYHIRTKKRSWRWPKYYILKKFSWWGCLFLTELSLCRNQARSRDRVSILGAWKGQSPGDPTGILTYHPASSSRTNKNEECKKFRKRSTNLLQLPFMKCAPFVLAFFCCTTNLCKKS